MTPVGSVRRIVAALRCCGDGGDCARRRAQRLSDLGARRIRVWLPEGQWRDAAGDRQCSCSIDVIASLLPYERYVTAETVLSMSQVKGNLGTQFRSSEQAQVRSTI